jgi:hypothetical protein
MANLWTTYDFAIEGVPGFHLGAGVNYVGKSYSDITNVNSIPSHVIANAAFGYEAPKWGIDLNVHNLTDRRYFVAANAAGAYVGEPLSAFVTLHGNFRRLLIEMPVTVWPARIPPHLLLPAFRLRCQTTSHVDQRSRFRTLRWSHAE